MISAVKKGLQNKRNKNKGVHFQSLCWADRPSWRVVQWQPVGQLSILVIIILQHAASSPCINPCIRARLCCVQTLTTSHLWLRRPGLCSWICHCPLVCSSAKISASLHLWDGNQGILIKPPPAEGAVGIVKFHPFEWLSWKADFQSSFKAQKLVCLWCFEKALSHQALRMPKWKHLRNTFCLFFIHCLYTLTCSSSSLQGEKKKKLALKHLFLLQNHSYK